MLAGVLVAPLGLPAGAAAALGVYGLDVRRRRREARRAADTVRAELPDVVDLLLAAVSAGLSVTAAIEVVAGLAEGPVSRALGETVSRSRHGDVVSALEAIPDLLGESVRPLARVLVDGLRHGAPVIAGLERLSRDGRAERRRRGEIRARRTSVRLVFPLVVCLLPAFALLTVVPALVASLEVLGA
ncbi:MAG: type II secretion system F family protein [Acidimicrobiales bacterium]